MRSDSVLTCNGPLLVWVDAQVGGILHAMCLAGGTAEVLEGLLRHNTQFLILKFCKSEFVFLIGSQVRLMLVQGPQPFFFFWLHWVFIAARGLSMVAVHRVSCLV